MQYVVDVVALLLACYFLHAIKQNRSRAIQQAPLPPGPKPLPIVGNVKDFPKSIRPEAFFALNQKYGEVVHLNLLGQPMIILGSYSAALELLDQRSANYSDRSPSVMAQLTGALWNLVLMGYGQRWRQQRKVFHHFFKSSAIAQYEPLQIKQTRLLLRRLLNTPGSLFEHVRLAFAALIMHVTYGIEVSGPEDEYVALEENGLAAFEKAFVPGKYLVETFPILKSVPKWFPLAVFHKDAAVFGKIFQDMRSKPYEATLENMRRGDETRSMVSVMVRNGEDDEFARDVSAVTYSAGADTVVSSLHVFFLTMTLHPSIQHRAQAELDAVVGPNRLPEFSDRHSLPYIQALILECLRWKPVVPMAFPHRSLEEDVFRGWRIPKGSVILASTWATARDPSHYPEPELFIPERFLKDGTIDPDILDPRSYSFGYGRRVCPGRHFAEASLFITIASVLHVFRIEPILDDAGRPVLPSGNMKPSFLSYPEPYKCNIRPRSSTAETLILSDRLYTDENNG